MHRDLKPENLILASKGDDSDVQIADFGFATVITEQEPKLYLRCGSPGYVAPEVLTGEGYSYGADVFSAGAIMFVLLTGRQLFKGIDYEELLANNKKCEIEFDPRLWDRISP